MLDAIFEDFEVVLLEVLDDLAFVVEDGDVEGDFFDFGADDVAAALFGDFADGGLGDVGVGRADRVAIDSKGWWFGGGGLGGELEGDEGQEERDPTSP